MQQGDTSSCAHQWLRCAVALTGCALPLGYNLEHRRNQCGPHQGTCMKDAVTALISSGPRQGSPQKSIAFSLSVTCLHVLLRCLALSGLAALTAMHVYRVLRPCWPGCLQPLGENMIADGSWRQESQHIPVLAGQPGVAGRRLHFVGLCAHHRGRPAGALPARSRAPEGGVDAVPEGDAGQGAADPGPNPACYPTSFPRLLPDPNARSVARVHGSV